MEKKQKPKYRNYSIYIYIVIIIIAYFLGTAIFGESVSLFGNEIWMYAIVSIIIGYIATVIFYELGKLLFGYIAGYHLIYINIFGFTLISTKNKLSFKYQGIENYGGKTLMAPNDEDGKKSHPGLYLLGGAILTIIIMGSLLGLSFYLTSLLNDETYQYCTYMICGVSLLILLLNLIPFFNDTLLDGFILRLLSANDENYLAYHHYLYNEEALYTAKHDLKVYEYQNYDEFFQAFSLIHNYYYYIDNNDISLAENMVDKALENASLLIDSLSIKAYSFKYYFMLTRGEDTLVEEQYWALDSSIRKGISSHKDFEMLKTSLLIASLIDLNYDLYEYITTKINSKKKKYYLLRQNKEDALIEKTLEYIKVKKPEWFTPSQD